jgi:hypothetical protein
MSKICKRCNVTILDDAMKCPLCNGVLEGADSDKSESLTYPDISTSLRKMQFIIRIVVFLAIIAFVTVVIVNYATFSGVYWSLLVGAELCYGCFVLIYIFHERRSLQRMIIGQMLAAAVVLLLTDFLVGWQGWSLSIALPITFLGVDVTAFVLMVVAIDGWQSYIMTEIGTFLLNSILLALVFHSVIDNLYTYITDLTRVDFDVSVLRSMNLLGLLPFLYLIGNFLTSLFQNHLSLVL